MADITITVNSTTVEETRAAQFMLTQVNIQLTEQQQPTHANVTDYLEDRIVNWLLPAWIRKERENNVETSNVQERWQQATDAERAAALAALPTIT